MKKVIHAKRTVAKCHSARACPAMSVGAATPAGSPVLFISVPRALVGALTDAGLLRRATLTQYAQRVLLRGIAEDLRSPGGKGSTKPTSGGGRCRRARTSPTGPASGSTGSRVRSARG